MAAIGRAAPDSDDPGAVRLTTFVRATSLWWLVIFSLALGGWVLQFGHQLVRYVAHNDPGAVDRNGVTVIAIGALVIAAAGALVARLRRGMIEARLYEIARRLSPLALVGPTVLLLHWRAWHERPLIFLVLVALVAFGLEYSVRIAAVEPPLLPRAVLADRLQGLLAKIRERAPRLVHFLPLGLVVLGAALYATYFGYYTVAAHLNGRSNSWDLGILDNLVYNTLHGGKLFKTSPIYGPEGSHLARHATFFAFVVAPIYAIAQRAETLLILQAVLVGAGALPLFALARRHLGAWPACLLALAYLLYAPLHGANLYDFHFLTLTPVFLLAIVWAFESRRSWLAWILVALTLSIREDVAAGLAVIGAYLLLSRARPRSGLALALIGLGYFLVMKMGVMPGERGAPAFMHAYRDLVPQDAKGLAGLGQTVLGNPGYTLDTLLREPKLVYALQILLPVFLLPLRRWLAALLLLPGLVFTLMASGLINNAALLISFQYTAHWTPYVFLGTVVVLRSLQEPRFQDDLQGPTRMRAALAALALATVTTSLVFGTVLQTATARGAFSPFSFVTTEENREHRKIRSELIGMVPPLAKIAASERLVPHVSNRPDAYTIRNGIHDADYLFFRFGMWDCHPGDLPRIQPVLTNGEFGVLEIRDVFVLAKRGAPTDQNRAVLRRIAEAGRH